MPPPAQPRAPADLNKRTWCGHGTPSSASPVKKKVKRNKAQLSSPPGVPLAGASNTTSWGVDGTGNSAVNLDEANTRPMHTNDDNLNGWDADGMKNSSTHSEEEENPDWMDNQAMYYSDEENKNVEDHE
uniref:Uncharacterized protein n=1 Tax=Mycena chlorophos TaxID=658473 RepID=A0ABQ0M6K2_MYCCL|nr:predicted protein [Mycena chlorophos]